jgi:hypothetical protein
LRIPEKCPAVALPGKHGLAMSLATGFAPCNRSTQEISLAERRFSDGSEIALLEIVDIPMLKPVPYYYQSENHLIDGDLYWTKTVAFPAHRIEALCDNVGSLWINGDHSDHGFNDRVLESVANTSVGYSLLLIKPQDLVIQVQPGYTTKRDVRALFRFNNERYRLRVTDPQVEQVYLRRQDGQYLIHGNVVLCVSLGEAYQNYCYKLVAAVIYYP